MPKGDGWRKRTRHQRQISYRKGIDTRLSNKINQEYEESYSWKLGCLESTLNRPLLKCQYEDEYSHEGCDFETRDKKEMVQHFLDKHFDKKWEKEWFENDNPLTIKPKTFDMVYIILSKLVYLATKEFKKKTYISIQSKDLHQELLRNVDFKVPNQEPYHILKGLGLLDRFPNQKTNPITLHSKLRTKIYNIHSQKLKNIVKESSYDDLKIKLSLLDVREIEIKPFGEPSRPSRQNDEKSEEKSSGSSEEADMWKV